jgi:hypothetical protein
LVPKCFAVSALISGYGRVPISEPRSTRFGGDVSPPNPAAKGGFRTPISVPAGNFFKTVQAAKRWNADLDSGVSSCADWNHLRRSRFFIAWTVFAAAVLVLRLGSRGDRFVVGAVWLALVLLPVERTIHQLAGFMARTVLPRCLLLSALALVWSWGNARFRLGGRPFHIEQLGIWRGYPLPFEQWIFIFNPSPASLREFHWFGFVGDVLIPTAAFLIVLR